MFKYTICFIKKGDSILLLNRNKPSWMGSWNGVGGRLEAGETPLQCVLREVYEETGIQLKAVEFKGIVTWTEDGIPTGGMYAFTAAVDRDFSYGTPRKTEEGILDWKTMSWILNSENTGIAANVPGFLSQMFESDKPLDYRCIFCNGLYKEVKILEIQDRMACQCFNKYGT